MLKNFIKLLKIRSQISNGRLKQQLFILVILILILISFTTTNFLTLPLKPFRKILLHCDGKKAAHLYPLNVTFLNQSIKALIPILHSLTGRSIFEIEKMMTAQIPELQYNKIHAHTLSMKKLSIAQVHQLIQDDKVVPNAAHFVLPFFKPTLQFHHLVCILSAYWIFKPQRLMLWYNEWPSGEYWDYLLQNISDIENKVIFVHRPVPTRIYTLNINVKEHQSDVIRMEALLIFGGAYFDLDVIVLKSMEHLRNYSFTIGRESPLGLCNGVMLSAPNSTFLSIWHLGYQVMYDDQWGEHSVSLPNSMQQIWPQHVHVEEDSMNRPNWMETALIYENIRVWPWKEKNYCMHLWYRYHNVEYNFEIIKKVNSTLGEMFQYVLFGSGINSFV